jgi:hypothetical protein
MPSSSVSFASDIRPLFCDSDVTAMIFAFDLSDFGDVRTHADAMYARLSNGSMPCDGAWPVENVALFKSWIDQGKKP